MVFIIKKWKITKVLFELITFLDNCNESYWNVSIACDCDRPLATRGKNGYRCGLAHPTMGRLKGILSLLRRLGWIFPRDEARVSNPKGDTSAACTAMFRFAFALV